MAVSTEKTLQKLNSVYSSINLGDFYDKEYCDYAIYRALQRIPHLVDGFAQTQRKVIYTCIDKNIDKKTKVSDLSAVVSLHTKYHHGSTSIESAITNLVPHYNNQIPLLREDGTYGSRSERAASASRYIETRLFKYSKVIFNEIDNENFVEKQLTEGKQIESKFMLPIIPLLLINGQSQIGVGYSSDVLPRDKDVIITIMKEILTGVRKEIPTNIPPIVPLFNGTIIPNDKGGWEFRGIATENQKGDIHITEVPPKFTRDKYLTLLEKLKDDGKIKSYVENIVGDDFDIVVKMTGSLPWTKTKMGDVKTKALREKDLLDLFDLVETQSENITVINTKNEIKRYNNVAEILFEYIMFMLNIYRQRKEFLVNKMERDAVINNEKIRFIKLIISDEIIIKQRSKISISEDLEKLNFVKNDESYDYLLRMPIASLTSEKIQELEEIINSESQKIIDTKNTSAAQLWLNDIEIFENYLKKGE